MIKISGDSFYYFDCDDTLVKWGQSDDPKAISLTLYGMTELLVPHEKHIALLKEMKSRNKTIVVWSQGGVEWAETVVKGLGLEEYVDLVVSKPDWCVDDLPLQLWIRRMYLKDDNSVRDNFRDEGNAECQAKNVNSDLGT